MMIMMMILRVLPLTPFYPLLSAQSGDKMNDFNSDEDDTVTTTHDDARGSFMCSRSFSSFTRLGSLSRLLELCSGARVIP
jgi:hypothetical protein